MPMDEGIENKVADLMNGNKGTFAGNASWTAGRFGPAVNFDGINSRVTIPNSPLWWSPNALTVCAWVYSRMVDGSGKYAFIAKLIGAQDYWGIWFYNGTALRWYGYTYNAPAHILFSHSTTTFPLNTWVHVACTWEADIISKIYLNGTENSSGATGTGGFTATTDRSISLGDIGWWDVGLNLYFDGIIDDVRIYNYALSAAEILELYKTSPVGTARLTQLKSVPRGIPQ